VARVLVCLAALAGLVIGGTQAVAPYRDVIAYRHAPPCAAGASDTGCVAQATATVVDKATGQDCSYYGPANDPGGGQHCTTYYRLQLQRALGTEWLDVYRDIYRAAVRGDTARLRTWHGAVVWLELRGDTEDFGPPGQARVFWLLALLWLPLGLAIWAAVSGRLGESEWFRIFAWLFVAMPVATLGYGLLLGFSLTVWFGLLVSVPFSVFFLWPSGGWSGRGVGYGRGWRRRRRRVSARR
jgi:hypothetical protein